MDKSLYYDPTRALSYNQILTFVIGARGIGKSFAYKKYVVNRFIKHGEQFIYLRRYKTELKKIKNFFDDIKGEFPEHDLKVVGRELHIDGKVAGFSIPLSSWQSEKSNPYPNVMTILFDEFIREKDNSGYLPNEVSALLNVIDTVIRMRDNTRCICMSNAVSVVNPYFLFFKLFPDIGKRFNNYKNKGILIEIPDSVDFSQQRRKTRFGKLIDGTEYGDMALDNVFTGDSRVFIEKRSPESRFVFGVVYQGMVMGVWVDTKKGLLYLSNDYDPSSKNIYAMTTDDLSENHMLMNTWRNNYHLLKMVRAFKEGYLRFDNQVLRNVGYEMFKKMGVQ